MKTNKQNMDKIIAKVIWNVLAMITIFAVIAVLVSVGAMIEDMAITFENAVIAAVASAWVAAYSLFIVWIESLD